MDGNPCNPTGGECCKVCVRVHNNSAFASSGQERLIVNWAKAGMGLSWNYGWLGNNCFAPGLPGSGYVTDAAGSYTVRLVSNRGNIFDSKTLVIR